MRNQTHEIHRRSAHAAEILRRRCGVFLCAAAICVFPSVLYGRNLAEYREAVETAKISVEDLLYSDAEEMSPAEFKEYERRAVAQIRRDLPASERVEWRDSAIEIDNGWLFDKLNEAEKATNDAAKRAAILTEIDERLGAVEYKLNELENSSAASDRTKDEDKRKLAEILRREEFQKPEEQPESFFARTWRQFQEWLAGKFPRADVPDTPSSGGFRSLAFLLQILLYAAILGLIGFIIYRFAPFFAEKFKGRERAEKRDRVILGERIAADETAENLFAEAENLARGGDLRGAIRKGYVALLCELSDRKVIGLARHKTNRDYLGDVRPRRDLYENVRGLTANFERHWYGFEAVEQKDWEDFRDNYKRTITN